MTGSILPEGPTTGICSGDTDVGVAIPTTDKEGPIMIGALNSSNKKSGASGTLGALSDTCEPEVVAVEGNLKVTSVENTHPHCTKKHTGVHVVVPGGADATSPIGGAGEN